VSALAPLGIDVLLADPERWLGGARRVALLANQASLTADYRSSLEALRAHPDVELVALLTPEHGWSGFEDDATPVADGRHPAAGLVQHSLYGPRRRPAPEVLRSVDAVVVDVQDVGVRCYTYATSVALLLEVAAETGTRVVVCDRPRVLGERVDGPPLDPTLRSFLGYLDVRYQHGATIGELARWHAASALAGAVDLVVVPHAAWPSGAWAWSGPWLPPSPGLPTRDAALLYPGLVLLEGINLSEGRGTSLPFQLIGAPWCDAHALARDVQALELPGLRARALDFRPVTDTFAGEVCHGVQLLVTDPVALRPLEAIARVLARLRERSAAFAWVDAATKHWVAGDGAGEAWYEPVRGPLVDALTGSDEVRRVIDGAMAWESAAERWETSRAGYHRQR